MTKVQVYFLAACVIASPHLSSLFSIILVIIAGFLCFRALRYEKDKPQDVNVVNTVNVKYPSAKDWPSISED